MKAVRLSTLLLFIALSAHAQQKIFDAFCSDFVSGYKALDIPQFDLSYVANFQHIGTVEQVKKQQAFFTEIKTGLTAYDQTKLTPSQKTDYRLMAYETDINLERIGLELRWKKAGIHNLSDKGIITLPDGKAWYAYYLKSWVSDHVTPDQIYQFGLAEVKRVQGHIEAVRKQTGLSEDAFYKHLDDSSFFVSDTDQVKNAFEHIKAIVYSNLNKLFSITTVPDLQIKRGEARALAQTPGYYTNNTFYYNLFDKPYNKRQYDWLFIHEAVPGHHYQNSIIARTKVSKIQELFFYTGFAEGWGAYAEELGKQLGLYQSPYDELGKWQWDIVRAVRVPLDVAINYYGWTDEQALTFWKKNIRGQDDIAMREIARVRRWPAQAVTYKYGAVQILNWKEMLIKKRGKYFNIKDFHDRILNHGSLPLFMVRENVFKG